MPFAQTVYTSVAPDTLRQVVVQEYGCSFDCAVRVVLNEKWRSETIASGDDCSVRFAHAAWKGTVVSVFVDGFWCGKIRTAYDTATGKPVDFASTEDWLRRDILAAYLITPQGLSLKDGAETPLRATKEFQTRHRKRPR